MNDILNTGIKNSRNVTNYIFGKGSIHELVPILEEKRSALESRIIFFIDVFFKEQGELPLLEFVRNEDEVIYIDTIDEPTTEFINSLVLELAGKGLDSAAALVGIGGGITLDVTKAVSNLLNNPGLAEDYQGWDLVKNPGIFKIGIPSLSGTGSEATRTCVMTNPKNGLKLGMNSDYTVFDQIIMDPDLSKSVPPNQYFYTGMDAYIHCIESLNGSYRNAIADSFSVQALCLLRDVFLGEDMMSDAAREKLMVASYLGGCSIGNSYVGVIHPLSAGLSVVFKLHHAVANCIVMRAMEEFYPDEYREFWEMVEKQGIEIPNGVCSDLDEAGFKALYDASIIHEKPLTNALGSDFRDILTLEKVTELFRKM